MIKERPSPSILQVLFIAALSFVAIAFTVITINTGDILWFWPVFDEMPERITIHCYGNDIVVNPGDPAYALVNSVINESLYGTKRWDSLSMSEVTYGDYQTSSTMMVLELGYNPPVPLHSFYKFFKSFDVLVIPLDGRHASVNSVFGRLRGRTLAGSMHVETTATVLATLKEQALCQKP